MDKGIYNPFTFVCAASRLESPPLMVKILKVMGAALRFSSCRPGHSCIFNVFAFSQKVSNWPERQTIAIHDCEEFVLFGFFHRLNLSGSHTFERLSELTRCPSKALTWPRTLMSQLQRFKDTQLGVTP